MCAVGQDARAFALVRNLRELHHTAIGYADRYQTAGKVLNELYATKEEKALARKERKAMIKGTARASGATAKLERSLKKASKRQRPGCLKKLFPTKAESLL